jgi:hypothetical protein
LSRPKAGFASDGNLPVNPAAPATVRSGAEAARCRKLRLPERGAPVARPQHEFVPSCGCGKSRGGAKSIWAAPCWLVLECRRPSNGGPRPGQSARPHTDRTRCIGPYGNRGRRRRAKTADRKRQSQDITSSFGLPHVQQRYTAGQAGFRPKAMAMGGATRQIAVKVKTRSGNKPKPAIVATGHGSLARATWKRNSVDGINGARERTQLASTSAGLLLQTDGPLEAPATSAAGSSR